MDAKLCLNCAHHQQRLSGTHACLHPDHQRPPSLVTGEETPTWCDTMRLGACGKDAVLFQPKAGT